VLFNRMRPPVRALMPMDIRLVNGNHHILRIALHITSFQRIGGRPW